MRMSDWSSDVCSSDLVPGQRLMTVRARDIARTVEYDPDPVLSYLDPDAKPEYAAQNAERLAAYRAGPWHCIGLKARYRKSGGTAKRKNVRGVLGGTRTLNTDKT